MSKLKSRHFKQLTLDLDFSNNQRTTDCLNLGNYLLNRLGVRTLELSSSPIGKESIYLLLHKLAEYIGSQHSRVNKQLIESANVVAKVIPFPYEQPRTILQASPCDISQVTMFEKWHPEMIIKLSPRTLDRYTRYLVVTQDQVALKRANRVLRFNTKGERRNTRFVFMSPALLIGLGVLITDIWKQYQRVQQSLNFSPNRLNDNLEYIVNTKYCYSVYDNNSEVISFLTDYLVKLSNLSLQQGFNQHTAVLLKSIHNEYQVKHHFVVSDNYQPLQLLVDNKGSKEIIISLQNALRTVWPILPHGIETLTIRLHELSGSRISGLYDPQTNEIVLDFPKRRLVAALAKAGLRTFLHEYAHYLDYQYGDEQLSLQPNFLPVLNQYRADHKEENFKQTAPTEVFALLFEKYLLTSGLQTVLLRDPEFYNCQSYQLSPNCQKVMMAYFNQTFSKLRNGIKSASNQGMLV